eukprot:Gb_08281 [translate_table: standard]
MTGSLVVRADPRINQAGSNCTPNGHYNSDTFNKNYVAVMASLSQQNDMRGFGTHIERNSSDPVYGLFQCLEDLSQTDCSLCFSEARSQMSAKCITFTGGRIYLDGCFMRYENYSFDNQIMDSGDSKVCDRKKSSQPQRFLESAQKLINNITSEAPEKEGFSVGSTEGPSTKIYGLAQCWKTLSKSLCKECLQNASAAILSCSPSLEGRALNAGCYMRYATHPFSPHQTSQAAPSTLLGSKHSKLPIILGTIAAAVVVVVGLGLLWKNKAIGRFNHKLIFHQNEAQYKFPAIFNSKLNFRYRILQIATENFDPTNKLGEGGFGSVYKGVLTDGREIAVKRLCFNRGRGVGEFFNEVNLINSVKHKNLVKLLGCSVKGPERLLVYEYVANKSLDQFLFDPNKNRLLDWPRRFDIILGTARGLAYLHEESAIRIIHRDIKASNILLDQNLKPKIADFGLARYFAADQSHLSTGIAGTLGYMAPEYCVRGQLTEKADVFSFGVLVIEIVSGKRNNNFILAERIQTLLAVIWNHYKSETVSDIIDSNIKENLHKEEALRVLQVALLCTQASGKLRPSMSEAIQMFTNKEQSLPRPKRPPFVEIEATAVETSHPPCQFTSGAAPVSFSDLTVSFLEGR